MQKVLLLLALGYLLGSIPTGLLLARALSGVDPRQRGSGNIGATNVLRTAGREVALLTLLGDVGKGALPVLVGKLWGFSPWALSGVAFSAFCGHLFPFYLKFKGGKGVATAAGVYLPLVPLALLIDLLIFSGVVAVGRMVSVGSLSAAVGMPFILIILHYPAPFVLLSILMGVLIFLKHKENIKRILRGEEHRLGR